MDPRSSPAFLRRVAELPDQPGVYLFKNAAGQVLYVGKALSLRRRVSSYFQAQGGISPRILHMIHCIADVEVQTTASEAEALLRESELIKRHKPTYNVAYRDDKSYPLLKLTREPFPRLMPTREKRRDAARYFGPYADAAALRQALQFLRRVFPLRTCRAFPKTPCLEYHLGQCLAPCVGYIDEGAYARMVRDLVEFLEGKRDRLLRELTRRMEQAARDQRFEEAARVRDQIQALTSVIVAKEKSAQAGALEQLQAALKLPTLPRRIEAFDISNMFGQFAVGSMITFQDGTPHKAHYRHFRIETVTGSDDFKMMQEVIRRRYGGSLAQELPRPDLILVDGGKGQLSAALEALSAAGVPVSSAVSGAVDSEEGAVSVVGLAKQHEELFLPNQRNAITLLPTSPVLHLVQHIRDEAHRFAIGYHRRLRGHTMAASRLDQVPGIGPQRKAALLSQFGSVTRLTQAAPEDVARVARISLERARRLVEALRAP